jgi:uncharacterized protein YigA (DUF484 family)
MQLQRATDANQIMTHHLHLLTAQATKHIMRCLLLAARLQLAPPHTAGRHAISAQLAAQVEKAGTAVYIADNNSNLQRVGMRV